MRISDWSSDVCSSDLGKPSAASTRCARRAGTLNARSPGAIRIRTDRVRLKHRLPCPVIPANPGATDINSAGLGSRIVVYKVENAHERAVYRQLRSTSRRAVSRSEEHKSELQSLMGR